MRDGDGILVVDGQQHLWRAVAEVIDDAVVQPAVARAGIQRDVRHVELAQHGGKNVAAPELVALARAHRRVMDDGGKIFLGCHGCAR
ncbi:hypothetical protein D3C83_31450 [compost metagenome]